MGYGPIMISFQWHALLRRQSNSKHCVLTILDVKVKGAKHIPSEWFSILFPCKQLKLAPFKKAVCKDKKKKPVIQTRQIKHSESIWIWFVSIRFQTASQPNTLAEAQFLLFPGISNQSLLCYLIYSCVLSCTSSTFPHVIIPSLGLFSSHKNPFSQTETFFMSADTKLQPRTRWLQSIGQACRWPRSISPCFAVA